MTAFGLVMEWLSEVDGMDGMYEDLMHYYYIEQNEDGFWVDDLLFADFEDAMDYVASTTYTGNELALLKATGKFTDYTKSSSKLRTGDILLRNGEKVLPGI